MPSDPLPVLLARLVHWVPKAARLSLNASDLALIYRDSPDAVESEECSPQATEEAPRPPVFPRLSPLRNGTDPELARSGGSGGQPGYRRIASADLAAGRGGAFRRAQSLSLSQGNSGVGADHPPTRQRGLYSTGQPSPVKRRSLGSWADVEHRRIQQDFVLRPNSPRVAPPPPRMRLAIDAAGFSLPGPLLWRLVGQAATAVLVDADPELVSTLTDKAAIPAELRVGSLGPWVLELSGGEPGSAIRIAELLPAATASLRKGTGFFDLKMSLRVPSVSVRLSPEAVTAMEGLAATVLPRVQSLARAVGEIPADPPLALGKPRAPAAAEIGALTPRSQQLVRRLLSALSWEFAADLGDITAQVQGGDDDAAALASLTVAGQRLVASMQTGTLTVLADTGRFVLSSSGGVIAEIRDPSGGLRPLLSLSLPKVGHMRPAVSHVLLVAHRTFASVPLRSHRVGRPGLR